MTQGRSPKNQGDVALVGWWLTLAMLALLLMGFGMAAFGQESPLSKEQSTWAYRGTLALMAVDMAQSLEPTPGLVETNPILGRRPPRLRVAAYFAGYAGLVTLVHYNMGNRAAADGLTIGVGIGEAYTVHHNHSVGVRIRF